MNGAQHKIVGAGFGIAGAYALMSQGNDYGVLVVSASIVGSMLPDIDHDRTKIGRKRKAVTETAAKTINVLLVGGILVGIALAVLTVRGMVDYGISARNFILFAIGLIGIMIAKKILTNSDIYQWSTKHRGLMHTLVPPAIIAWATTITDAPSFKYTIMGILIGYLSHLFADSLTVDGVPILFPLSRSCYGPKLFKTKDNSTTIVAWIVAILAPIITLVVINYF